MSMVSIMFNDNSFTAICLADYRVKTNFVFSELSKVKFGVPLDPYLGFLLLLKS